MVRKGPHRIASRKSVYTTPWFSLEQRKVVGEKNPFYALKLPDYVGVFATTAQSKVLLVEQFRPATEDYMLELPAGHVDQGETPKEAARRELFEETGYSTRDLSQV